MLIALRIVVIIVAMIVAIVYSGGDAALETSESGRYGNDPEASTAQIAWGRQVRSE